MLIKNFLIYIIIANLILLIFIPKTANAGSFLNDNDSILNQWGRFTTLSYGDPNDTKAPEEIVAQIIGYLLSFLGVLFIILMIYAGFLWMSARGDSEQITKAKEILTSSIIGIVIVLSSYIITTTILKNLGEATGTL